MSVNGVTSNSAASAYEYQAATKSHDKAEETKKENTNDSGVIYEQSNETAKATKYKPDAETIARLKSEVDARKSQLMELVKNMISGQGNAQNKADCIWALLRDGKLTVDAATRDQAVQDISEDGYWGVKQTSERILDFAKALTGGDPSKIDEMEKAFEKGFKMAEKIWGGKLPEISQQTFDAVRDGFQKMREEAGLE
ncbi:MAG: hypothetical protein FWC09_02695 [Lachnospiraceae bacterium]|nr:hypothetical protein [Lachnospiraceae bacterium]